MHDKLHAEKLVIDALDSITSSMKKERLRAPEVAEKIHFILEYLAYMLWPLVLVILFFTAESTGLQEIEKAILGLLVLTLFTFLVINYIRYRRIERKVDRMLDKLDETMHKYLVINDIRSDRIDRRVEEIRNRLDE